MHDIETTSTTVNIRLRDYLDGPAVSCYEFEVRGALSRNDIIEVLLTPTGDEWPLPYEIREELSELNWGASSSSLAFVVDALNNPWVVATAITLGEEGVRYAFTKRKGSLSRLPNASAAAKAKSYVASSRAEISRDLTTTNILRDRPNKMIVVEITSPTMVYTVEVKRYRSDETYGFSVFNERTR